MQIYQTTCCRPIIPADLTMVKEVEVAARVTMSVSEGASSRACLSHKGKV